MVEPVVLAALVPAGPGDGPAPLGGAARPKLQEPATQLTLFLALLSLTGSCIQACNSQSTYLYRGVQGKFDDDSAPTFLKHGNCCEN